VLLDVLPPQNPSSSIRNPPPGSSLGNYSGPHAIEIAAMEGLGKAEKSPPRLHINKVGDTGAYLKQTPCFAYRRECLARAGAVRPIPYASALSAYHVIPSRLCPTDADETLLPGREAADRKASVGQSDLWGFASISRLAVMAASSRVMRGSSIPMIRINSSSLCSQAERPNRTSCSCGVSRQPPRVFTQKTAAVTHCGPSVVALRNRDLLEAKSLQWKVYAEDFPGHCFLGERQGDYVRKHAPMLSFKNVQSDLARCSRVVEAAQLSQDLQSGTLPDFSLYIPNLKNDGHDTNVAFADKWLASKFGPLLADPRFTKDLLFVVTFDEAEHFFLRPSSNHILTVLVGDGVLPGSQSKGAYTHYSILRTVEDGLGTGTLDREDTNAAAITGIWR